MKPLRSPIKVSLDITSRCNMSCAHCRISVHDTAEELHFSEIRAILDDLARQRVLRVGISGGEPFIRDDTPEIIRYAARHAAGRVFVSTNGDLVDENLLNGMGPARDRLTMKISLDGPREIHDSIRGRMGAFDAARNAISLCHDSGFSVEVTTTISRGNVAHLRKLAHQIKEMGCSRYNMVEILPVGHATKEMCLDPAMRAEAWSIVRQIRSEFAASGIPLVAKIPFAEKGWQTLHCNGGISECGILSDGSVVGCRLLPHIKEGNVRDRPLGEIWSDPRSFAFFRAPVADLKCRSCSDFLSCGGGCRAYSFGLKGDPYAPDPRCPHLQDGDAG
jgi:radical SAM protein with 4Fe4S-binding SPASM domain